MSNADLMPIVSMLPEQCLEKAIIDCLQTLLLSSEWDLAGRIADELLVRSKDREVLKGETMVFGVQLAVKKGELTLAIHRFYALSKYGNTPEFIDFKSDALFYLSAALLPDHPSLLKQIWEDCMACGLPLRAQHNLSHIGTMLARQLLRNRDMASAKIVCQTMRKYSDLPIYDEAFQALENAINGSE